MIDDYSHESQLSLISLYQLLTQFIKVWKDLITNSNQIIASLVRSCKHTQLLSVSDGILLSLQTFINIGNVHIKQTSHLNQYLFNNISTYFRFSTRLIQIISIFHSKDQTQPIHSFYISFLHKMQGLINNFKLNKNLAFLFSNCYYLSTLFYKGCNLIIKRTPMKQVLQILNTPHQSRQLNEEPSQIGKVIINTIKVENPSARKEANISLIHWLDVDFSYFNSMIFLANNQKQELIRLMCERNKPIHKFIANYTQEFQNYLKRKQKLEARRNRLKQLKDLNLNTFTTNFKPQNKISKTVQHYSTSKKEQSIASTKTLRNRVLIYEAKGVTDKRQTCQQDKKNCQHLAQFHPIKNIFLTFNNNEIQKTPKNAYYRNLQDSHKGISIQKDSKYVCRPLKRQEKHLQRCNTTSQMSRLTISNVNMEKRNKKIIQLHSFSRHPQIYINQPFQKLSIIQKSRNIRAIRKSQMGRTLKHFNLTFQQGNTIKTDMNKICTQSFKSK